MKNKKKTLLMSLAAVLLVVSGVFGTLAWLTDSTDSIENTFTVGNIDIELEETEELDLKMVPGHTIKKDPKVTVEDGSEDAWVFVKVDKSDNLDDFITYAIEDGWTLLESIDNPNGAGVWYREVNDLQEGKTFSVLVDDQVTVKDEVTKEMMDAIENDAKEPTLTFTAYAVQKNIDNGKTATPDSAWKVAQDEKENDLIPQE